MKQDQWVLNVLQDIKKFAKINGYTNLTESIDQTTEAFLKDYRAKAQPEINGADVDSSEE